MSSVSKSLIFFFSYNTVLIAESLEVLVMAFEVLHKEVKPLELKGTIQFVYTYHEDTEFESSFT